VRDGVVNGKSRPVPAGEFAERALGGKVVWKILLNFVHKVSEDGVFEQLVLPLKAGVAAEFAGVEFGRAFLVNTDDVLKKLKQILTIAGDRE
jgi:hypothetical protein